MADALQQKLNSFTPQDLVDDPYGANPTVWEAPVDQGPGMFYVEPLASTNPSMELVRVYDSDFELELDPVIALEYVGQLPLQTDKTTLWEALSSASAESDLTAYDPAAADDAANAAWNEAVPVEAPQQSPWNFSAKRKFFF